MELSGNQFWLDWSRVFYRVPIVLFFLVIIQHHDNFQPVKFWKVICWVLSGNSKEHAVTETPQSSFRLQHPSESVIHRLWVLNRFTNMEGAGVVLGSVQRQSHCKRDFKLALATSGLTCIKAVPRVTKCARAAEASHGVCTVTNWSRHTGVRSVRAFIKIWIFQKKNTRNKI